MIFYVVNKSSEITYTPNACFLLTDEWDDWFKFSTMYVLYYIDNESVRHKIGFVKIGQVNMKKDQRRPQLSESFDVLGDSFFSVGQDESYYLKLKEIEEHTRNNILLGLSDMAYDDKFYNIAKEEQVTSTSLFRSVSKKTIKEQFRRILNGEATLTSFNFTYNSPIMYNKKSTQFNLAFSINPDSNPPSNIHVLIGRNGIGKTTLLQNMANSILNDDKKKYGYFNSDGQDRIFSNLISISYSAFDDFEIMNEQQNKKNISNRYVYIGLKRKITNKDTKQVELINKSKTNLETEFANSLFNCIFTTKKDLWNKIILNLSNDPIFHEANIIGLSDLTDEVKGFKNQARKTFSRLSSGHKIVLLALTRLIEIIEEKSLVLIDEPEAHLHPPLLSAYIRTLSELLKYKNAVSIVATHSPIVLQEVSSNCVWILSRQGFECKSERPGIESFGENVGILTREVFTYELTGTGFHNLLEKYVDKGYDFNQTIQFFDDQISYSAIALIRNLISERDRRENS